MKFLLKFGSFDDVSSVKTLFYLLTPVCQEAIGGLNAGLAAGIDNAEKAGGSHFGDFYRFNGFNGVEIDGAG